MNLPERIGKYEMVEFLGGGMAHVFRAQDTLLGRTVAVKILTQEGNSDPETRKRFLMEARAACKVNHDNIISVFDFGEEQGRPYMVMEFLRGQNLSQVIKEGKAGDLRARVSIGIQLARALEHIHEQRIIHRDIKPENIHIDPAGRVKLMDFGIAKSEGVHLTRAGFTLGTPFYMAPEQVMGQQVTNLVDVYAFGVLMFELLTGSKAVTADTVERIFSQILYEPLNMAALDAAAIPEVLKSLIARCAAKNPADRIQGFSLIRAEMERYYSGQSAVTSRELRAAVLGTQANLIPKTAAPAPAAPIVSPSPVSPPPATPRAAAAPVATAPVRVTTPPVPKAPPPRMAAPPVERSPELPGWIGKLPPPLQTQGGLIAAVAAAVFLGMIMLYAIIRVATSLL
jgi:eukaryotic-like serine/threonine-protein kinase